MYFRLFSYTWYTIKMLYAAIQSSELVDFLNEQIFSSI